MDLSTLRREGESLFRALAVAARDRRSGAVGTIDFPRIFAAVRAVTSLEAFACAREAFDHASEADKPLARAAVDLVATAMELSRIASLDAEVTAFEARTEVVAAGDVLPLREVPRRMANEPVREMRSMISRAGEHALAPHDRRLARRVEEGQELAADLAFATHEALWTTAKGLDLAALAQEAESTLKATEDAWRDLLAFGLRRAVGPIAPRPRGEAAAHDIARFARLAPLDDIFKHRRLMPSAQQLLEAIGLEPSAGGRIEVDLDEGSKRPPGGGAIAIDVPDEIAVVIGSLGGAADFKALFHALGRAHFAAGTSPDLPVELRLLGDRAGSHAFGVLFDHLLLDSAFLRRVLDADPKEATEAARLVAIERLGTLRRACAGLLFDRTLFAEGPREELRGLYRELAGKALAVDWPVEPWLWDVTPRLGRAEELRGFALAEGVRQALLNAANEDWWRNPRAGRLLASIAARGGRDSAESIARDLGTSLSLISAAERLVEVAAR